jgi:hypothetical protein
MPLETLGIAIGCAVVGYAFGKRSSAKEVVLTSQPTEQKAEAYKELFAAFVDADRALMNAHMEEEASGQIPEETKELVGASLNDLFRIFESTRFMFPQAVTDAMEELYGGHLGMPWGEQCDELRRVKDSVYSSARKDIGTDL